MQTSVKKVKQQRSRIACKRCHDRRVKCDLSARGSPCSGCIAGRVAESCRPLDSRRSRGENGRFSARVSDRPSSTAAAPSSPLSGATAPIHGSGSPMVVPADGSSTDSRLPRECPPASANNGQSPGSEADQWSKIITNERPRAVESRRITYLGESWTLSYMTQWKSRGSVTSPSGDGEPGLSPSTADDKPGGLHVAVPMDPEETPSPRMIRPSKAGHGQQLPLEIQMALIDAYFTHNHVLHPVILQQEFRQAFASGTASELLLPAVLYGGAIHASDGVIYRAGFESREACLLKLYKVAKRIYFDDELDGEVGDQLSRVQAAFLLHNMWSSPNAMMDPWSWLGLSIRLAQNMGMHRSTAKSSLREDEQKLWKRVWWALYTRDRQSSCALGKPLMINDADCDVEFLTTDDFEVTDSYEMCHFVIEQTRLAGFGGKIFISRFTPGSQDALEKKDDRVALMNTLVSWKERVPDCLQRAKYHDIGQVPAQALFLEVLFNNLLLMLHRPRLTGSDTTGFENEKGSWKIAFDAAKGITQITEMIMNYKSLYQCSLFYTSALFGAMTMHAIRGPAAEHQLSICMIAMRTLSTMYWAAGWIRNIFQKLGEKKQKSLQGIYTSTVPTRAPSPVPAGEASQSRPDESSIQRQQVPKDWSAPAPSQSESADATRLTCQDVTEVPNLVQTDGGMSTIQYGTFPGAVHDPTGLHYFNEADGRNMGAYMDYPMIDHSGLASIDPDFADWWQDLLAADNPFSNPFITGGMTR